MAATNSIEISVAIATYNGTKFVTETLNSILDQTLPPKEVIVVNDGSTDNTLDVLAEFGDRIKVMTIENSGPETAKKIAIEKSNCEWIAICDHDDLWKSDHLERLALLVASYPEVCAAYSNFEEFGDSARFLDKFKSMPSGYWDDCATDDFGFRIFGPEPFKKWLLGSPFFPSAGIFRRSIYNTVGGIRPGISRNPAADGDLTSRILLSGRVGCDSKITVGIRKYGGNYSGEGIRNSRGSIELLERQLAEGGIYGPYQSQIRETIRLTAIGLMQAAFSYRDQDAFAFAAKRLPFTGLSLSMKFRYLIFQFPNGMLRVFMSVARALKR